MTVMTTSAGVRRPEGHVGRAAAVGGVTGMVIVSVSVWLLGLAQGLEALPAVGLGLFVGGWGGLGFGAMLGACVTGGADQ
jgi:hypothetical protein